MEAPATAEDSKATALATATTSDYRGTVAKYLPDAAEAVGGHRCEALTREGKLEGMGELGK
ncbi:hypothetical protein E2562_032627 [Oryza meyeriana var. granulata]|uniref:Uncharacterized protein n=1 Tax=Oryza meyeriana var. granulata TaxID=110450 RepID=A0A6G1DA12_9ORYZ|nr:hypothetical protein E2562_032627 [Oryza meyeriana var. granulata]